jgi:hypothetical protein
VKIERGHTDSDGVTVLDSESGRAVSSEVLVSFLVSLVFRDATWSVQSSSLNVKGSQV